MTKRTHRTTKASLGVTLVELLVTLVIGLIIMGLTFTIVMANRNLMTRDQINTELNQNLRIGADIIGDDIRVAGQGILVARDNRRPITIQNNVLTIRNEVPELVDGALETVVYRRRYWVNNNILWLRVSRSKDGKPFENFARQGVVDGIQAMNISAVLQNGNANNTVDTLDTADQWDNLRAVQIQLIGAADIRGETYTSELTSSFFPRNVFSQ